MPNRILLEEFHITITAPVRLPQRDSASMLRVLRSRRFQGQLRDAVRAVFRRHPSLKKTNVEVER